MAANAQAQEEMPATMPKLYASDGGAAVDPVAQIPVAILTPTGRDGIVAGHLLRRFGIQSRLCSNMEDICKLIEEDAIGVILVAEEALVPAERLRLFESLNQQPSWSDIPIILLTGEGELSSSLPRALSGVMEKGNVTLLERPVKVATLTTLIRSAQRARLRQLDVRDYIESRNESEKTLRESEQRLRSAVLSAPYPLMLHDDKGEILQLSRAWISLTGYDAASMLTTGEWANRAFRKEGSGGGEFAALDTPEGVSVHLGERQVQTAGGALRTWDFHRVALGRLPDGRRLNLTAAIDVTAYKRLVESERSARKQAEEANSAKSQFLATMSHELRTPLNAIAGYTQLLSLGLRGPVTPEQQGDLDRIDRSQRHLLSLINDILNFAKIEAGHIAVENAQIDLTRILDGLKEFVEPQLREKTLNFSVINSCPEATGRGDEDKVRQILINLLSNAIKFTPVNGHINVECNANDGTLDICVSDDGVGIPPDKLDAIFEPFVQVGRDFSSPQGGTGLGLSISRDLARRMGGDLAVKSVLGKGSTFTLKLRKDE